MNKQEAIEEINNLKGLTVLDKTINFDSEMISKKDVLNIVKQFDEPEKPVVPQFVADWVANSREYDYEFCDFFDCNYQSEEVYRWLKCENRRQSELNSLALSMLVVHGRDAVIVEEEKLYTVEIPNPNSKGTNKIYLCKDDTTGKVYLCKGNFNPSKNRNLRLTESEIKQDFDWAWKFAEVVEE